VKRCDKYRREVRGNLLQKKRLMVVIIIVAVIMASGFITGSLFSQLAKENMARSL
jgi:hypothetical protein